MSTPSSPMILRIRQTPKKSSADPCTDHDDDGHSSKSHSSRSLRRRNPVNYLEMSPQRGERQVSPGSNAENEGVRESNETTPLRGRRVRPSKSSSSIVKNYVSKTTINDEEKRIRTVIRSVAPAAAAETPTTRSLSLRSSVIRRNAIESCQSKEAPSSSDEHSSDERTPRRTRSSSRKSNYFSVKHNNNESESSESDDDDESCSSTQSDDEALSSDCDDDVRERTPINTPVLSQVNFTPDLLKKLEGRSVKRRLAIDSPVSTSSHAMSPNPEKYFLAENRIKFRKTKMAEAMNDAMKGKRRKKRQLIRGDNSRLPEKVSSNFSVTTAAIKATVPHQQDFIAGNAHEEEVGMLLANTIENEFPHWLGLFRDGFNVMLYGYGSKLIVFAEFQRFVNDFYLTVSVNGLFPKLNARKLLYGICEHVNPKMRVPHGTSMEAVAREAFNLLNCESHNDLFILVNNFDNLALRSPQILTVLCWLAQVPYIHILASCDTVNAFLGVTQSESLQLKFCWMHCPTFRQYREELKWKPGIYGDESKAGTQKSSLKYVLQSLTGNARKAFTLLAQMQLKQVKSLANNKKAKEASFAGVKFQELAKECREKFIAHSDESLRTLLVEFFDHKLIKQSGKGRHLETMLLIELENDTLEEVISELV